jgi:20S proteasome alpha/beta subunit
MCSTSHDIFNDKNRNHPLSKKFVDSYMSPTKDMRGDVFGHRITRKYDATILGVTSCLQSSNFSMRQTVFLRSLHKQCSILILVVIVHIVYAAHSRQRRMVVYRRYGDEDTPHRYDRSVTTFDPTGRLLQVEYGTRAADRGETVVALIVRDSIFVVMVHSPSGQGAATTQSSPNKVHRIDEDVWMIGTGLAGDARHLASKLRSECQRNRIMYGEPMTVSQVAQTASRIQHDRTRIAGKRPLGVTALILGHDPNGVSNQKLSLFRCSTGGSIENCWYCATGKEGDTILATLHDQYETISTSNSLAAETEDETQIIRDLVAMVQNGFRLQHPKQQHASTNDMESFNLDIWVFRPRNPTICFTGIRVGDDSCLVKVSEYFKTENRIQ